MLFPRQFRQLTEIFNIAYWQRRFWEHALRDEADWQRHVDYIHFNPVKHKHVARVMDWPYSTFHRYVKLGMYPGDWGGGADDEAGGQSE